LERLLQVGYALGHGLERGPATGLDPQIFQGGDPFFVDLLEGVPEHLEGDFPPALPLLHQRKIGS
jgi:hypothetical protein